jgi:hypothetical protein
VSEQADVAEVVETGDPDAGAGLVNLDFAGTGLFVGSGALGVAFPDQLGVPSAVVAGALFTIGCASFLWAYAVAVSRSRTDLIGIGGLFFLAGTAPKVVRFRLRIAFAVQIVTAIATASIRPYTVAAFGILVPVFGLGLMGLWGARFGTFHPRPTDAGD